MWGIIHQMRLKCTSKLSGSQMKFMSSVIEQRLDLTLYQLKIEWWNNSFDTVHHHSVTIKPIKLFFSLKAVQVEEVYRFSGFHFQLASFFPFPQ